MVGKEEVTRFLGNFRVAGDTGAKKRRVELV
jgi:hypothetical protein